MSRVLPFPQASAAAWRASAWQLSSQSLNRAPEAGTDTDPGHWNCASGTELMHWVARGNCCGVRSSVLQRALPSHLLGQCRALREAEGELMAARTWARTGACGLSPVFLQGWGRGAHGMGAGKGPAAGPAPGAHAAASAASERGCLSLISPPRPSSRAAPREHRKQAEGLRAAPEQPQFPRPDPRSGLLCRLWRWRVRTRS